MAVTITNNGNKITITEGSESHSYSKGDINTGTFGDYVILYKDYKEHRRFLYSDVTTPSNTDSLDLKTQIDLILNSSDGLTSIANSTTEILTSGSTFTGEWELNNFSDVMVYLKTDTNCTVYMDFSPDGTNNDSTLSFNYDTARINPPHVLVKAHRYFRIRITNTDVVDQTYIRANVYYGTFNKLTSAINGTLPENFDAIAVRPTNYVHEVAMGKRAGRTLWNKFGYNLDVDTTTDPEILASWGGTWGINQIMGTAQTFTITYTPASDGSTATGARSILFYYLDASLKAQTAIHTLGSSGSDTTSFTGLGINRLVVYSNGGAGFNNADITVTATNDTTTQGEIPAGGSVSQQMIFHVQTGHTALIEFIKFNLVKLTGGGQKPVVTIKMYAYNRGTQTRYEIFRTDIDSAVDNHISLDLPYPFILNSRDVCWVTVETDQDNTVINARMSLIEERIT